MKSLIKFILSFFLLVVGLLIYSFNSIIWIDNNTRFTIENCDLQQQLVIEEELGIVFPENLTIDKLFFYATWGNDTRRSFIFEITVSKSTYEQLKEAIPSANKPSLTMKILEEKQESYKVTIHYSVFGHSDIEKLLRNEGYENTTYKTCVLLIKLVLVILISLIPLIPFKKLLRFLEQTESKF